MTGSGRSEGRVRFGLPGRDSSAPPPLGSGGAAIGLSLVVAVLGVLLLAAVSGSKVSAQSPRLFAGSLVLEDARPLTVINVATAQVTVRLAGVDTEVGASNYQSVQAVPVSGGTVLVNTGSGNFNYLAADNYVSDPHGSGVGLGRLDGAAAAHGYPAGRDAYIVRTAQPSTVSLVGRSTVEQAAAASAALVPRSGGGDVTASPAAAVAPLGFSSLAGPVGVAEGQVAASGSDLWLLVGRPGGCRIVQIVADPTSRLGLSTTTRGSSAAPCQKMAVETASLGEAVAEPGSVQLFSPARERRPVGPPRRIATPFTGPASTILPVKGAGAVAWFLARSTSTWQLFGVSGSGAVSGPYQLPHLSGADPAEPVLSGGLLYTIDRGATGGPTLWTIDPAGGQMAPLEGQATYPRVNSENANFTGVEVVLDGSRVVFNNPQSLEAVVVFTDGSRAPVIVDKSQAVTVSATGPADLNVKAPPPTTPGKGHGGGPATSSTSTPEPAVQAVSQQVTCANTTQKPYAPQITGVSPSSGTALVVWSYQLLDQTDCEPSSWSVAVTALTGGHQPDQPLQVVYGQSQYLFEGLRPATTYQVVVTAYINRQSTESSPVTFTTAARGPDAPLSVTTSADGAGNWVVQWTPCTEAVDKNCVVPAAQWSVIGAACAGSFVGSPPSVQVAGNQDAAVINAAALDLLGDSLSFSVQGSLDSGLKGNPTGDHGCTEAYQKPDASAVLLRGQGQADPATGTITATLTVGAATGSNPASVFGVPPADAEFVYTLSGVTPARTVGPVSQTSVTITGLPAGVPLVPSVQIYPAGHLDAAVTVPGPPFSQTLAWPTDLNGGTLATGSVNPKAPDSGTIVVTLPLDAPSDPLTAAAPLAANAPGAGPVVQCGGPGGATLPAYPPQAVSADHQLVLVVADPLLVLHGGSCTVSFSLTDGAQPNPYGGPSPDMTAAFTIGSQPSYSFDVSFIKCAPFQCGPFGRQYAVDVTTGDPFQGGGQWTFSAGQVGVPPATDPCYVSVQSATSPPSYPVELDLPQPCVQVGRVAVTVSWLYLGQQGTWSGAPAGPPPPPATTTTTTSPSTTSTTLAPCPSTTVSPTTKACSGATTTSSAAVGAPGGAARGTVLAAARSGGGPGASRGSAWPMGVLLVAAMSLLLWSPLAGRTRRHHSEKRRR